MKIFGVNLKKNKNNKFSTTFTFRRYSLQAQARLLEPRLCDFQSLH